MALQLQWARLVAYLVARLNESSTYAGLVFFASGCGILVSEKWALIINGIGLAVAGALRALLPNNLGGSDQ